MAQADAHNLKVFAGSRSSVIAQRVCERLELPLAKGRCETFPDGELITKVDEDVRGRDCFIVLSTCQPVNDNILELLLWIDCLRRASAWRITAVVPYYGYARQDRKDEGRVPITAKLIANVITKAGADRVLAMDLHAAQIQGFFDIPVDHLSASPVFVEYFQQRREELGDLVVVSPDVGNVKVANRYADLLGGDLAIVEKRRLSGVEVNTANLVGDVRGKTVLMMDDMISTAGTVTQAARLVMDRGAERVIVGATHAVFVGMAIERLASAPIEQVVVTNTIPADGRRAPIADKLVELCVGPLLGDAIHRIHHNMSVSALFRLGTGPKR
ncbi:MAG: ribose-phosphate pyrophosphokinase [Planctomycetota bacterium]|nr:MAG: ribose-phosphate pyrophosphokinase [Planctomycetota bacterium]